MSKNILNKDLAKASGVLLIHQGKIVDFFPQPNIIGDRDTGRSRGFGFVEMSSAEEAQKAISEFDSPEIDGRKLKGTISDAVRGTTLFINNSQEEVDVFDILLKDFKTKTRFFYGKIEESQKEIKQLKAKSAKRQKRFKIAMQKLEGLLNND